MFYNVFKLYGKLKIFKNKKCIKEISQIQVLLLDLVI